MRYLYGVIVRRIFSLFLSSGRCWQRCVLSAVNLPARMGTHRFHALVNIYSCRFCPLLSEQLGTGMDTTVVCLRWRSCCLFSAWRDKYVLALYGREQTGLNLDVPCSWEPSLKNTCIRQVLFTSDREKPLNHSCGWVSKTVSYFRSSIGRRSLVTSTYLKKKESLFVTQSDHIIDF